MCDARRISARGVSLGVQRHVLDRATAGGRTVTAHEGAFHGFSGGWRYLVAGARTTLDPPDMP